VKTMHDFFKNYFLPILADPDVAYRRKSTPAEELQQAMKYQIAVTAAINKSYPEFKTPYFKSKFLKSSDLNEELIAKVSKTFKLVEIRPDFPPAINEPGELIGYEKILGLIDTSGEENTRDYGIVFGRRGLYVRNMNVRNGKFQNGAYLPYTAFEYEFPVKLLPTQNRSTKKATTVKLGYGCNLELSNINEVISNDQIVQIFETIIEAIKLVVEMKKKRRISRNRT